MDEGGAVEKTTARVSLQNVCHDGISICGRFTSIVGTGMLASYLVASLTPMWSFTDSLNVNNGLESVTEAYFGLRGYCLKTRSPTLDAAGGGLYSCYNYEDTLFTYTPSVYGNNSSPYVWHNMTGCDRFPEVCEKSTLTQIVMGVSVILVIIGATFSEKLKFFGWMLLLAGIGGIAVMSMWLDWLSSFSGTEFSADIGLWFVIIGFCLGLIGFITACCNNRQQHETEIPGICSDGINTFGRCGSILTIICWGMVLVALTMTEWTSVEDLGTVGNLCNDTLLSGCSEVQASFGLYQYCVKSVLDINGGARRDDVCLAYEDEVFLPGGGELLNGYDRFSAYSLQSAVQLSRILAVFALLFGIFADIFSEKLLPAGCLCILSVGCNIGVIVVWMGFQSSLGEDTPRSPETSNGLFLMVGSLLVGFTASVFYCVDGRRARKSKSVKLDEANMGQTDL